MSKLSDLEAALEGKREAYKAFISSPVDTDRTDKYRAWESSHRRLHAILTDDTIRAFIGVAEAVDALPCIDLDREYPTGRCDDCERDALCRALTPLVKEADDE